MNSPEYTYDWFSQALPNLEKWVLPFKGEDPLTFMEIGCFEGRCTVWLMENILVKDTDILSAIDNFKGEKELNIDMVKVKNTFIKNVDRYGSRVHLHIGDSRSIIQGLGRVYDFVYVDGGHTAENTLTDSLLAWDLLRSGGVMLLDDYEWPGHGITDAIDRPKLGIDMFLELKKRSCCLLHKEYQVCVRKL